MKTESPLKRAIDPDPQPVTEGPGAGRTQWRPRLEFGIYLRQRREDTRMSLRTAAKELDLSFTRLQKLEAGGRVKPPGLEFLTRASVLYRVPLEDMLREAGFESMAVGFLEDEQDFELGFDALAFHPDLNPHGMDREWAEAYAPRVKRQWIEFAHKLEDLWRNEPGCLERILESREQAARPLPEAEPEAIRQWTLEQILRSGAIRLEDGRSAVGPFLRSLRKKKGVTLQVASRDLGLSYGTMHRIETGERPVDSLELLRPLVGYYGLELEEALTQMGIDPPAMRALFKQEAQNVDFAVLMETPELRPMGMTPQWMEKISAAQRQHFVDFAERLVSHLEQGGPGVTALVANYRELRKLAVESSG